VTMLSKTHVLYPVERTGVNMFEIKLSTQTQWILVRIDDWKEQWEKDHNADILSIEVAKALIEIREQLNKADEEMARLKNNLG
jgi:uncharacterized protein YkuJ